MSERPKSRKKHMVEGEVSEIKKQDEGLGLDKVGDSINLLRKMIRLIRGKKEDE